MGISEKQAKHVPIVESHSNSLPKEQEGGTKKNYKDCLECLKSKRSQKLKTQVALYLRRANQRTNVQYWKWHRWMTSQKSDLPQGKILCVSQTDIGRGFSRKYTPLI
ncbi:unnamed protein product [Lepeophtheirus salmonis]|uniref:(salmon louse) hypothetical protein n=1 Tax=Lepeophtheirus salmonis TaxID=72036 RepID=A0A7R8HD20_LEPSM|nr:unnamed protein product [Lepeophtheirus salmonis]CAF3014654.1 unnamed protein product [Lepeophtheirus salmonis]